MSSNGLRFGMLRHILAFVIFVASSPAYGGLNKYDLRSEVVENAKLRDLEGRRKVLLIFHDGKSVEYDIPESPSKRTVWGVLLAGQQDNVMATHHRMVVRVYTKRVIYMYPMRDLTGDVLGLALVPGDIVELFVDPY
jgi:hypothetical protein